MNCGIWANCGGLARSASVLCGKKVANTTIKLTSNLLLLKSASLGRPKNIGAKSKLKSKFYT